MVWMRTSEEVRPVFSMASTGGWAQRGGALFEPVLLLLEGGEVVNPFDNKEAMGEWPAVNNLVPLVPRNKIKRTGVPFVVFP